MRIKPYEEMYKDRIPYLPKAEHQLVMFQQALITDTYRESEGLDSAFTDSGMVLQGMIDDKKVPMAEIIKVALHNIRFSEAYKTEILERVAMQPLDWPDAEYFFYHLPKSARSVFVNSPNVKYNFIFRGLAARHPEYWIRLAENPWSYSGDIKYLNTLWVAMVNEVGIDDPDKPITSYNDTEWFLIEVFCALRHIPVWTVLEGRRLNCDKTLQNNE